MWGGIATQTDTDIVDKFNFSIDGGYSDMSQTCRLCLCKVHLQKFRKSNSILNP